MSCDFSGAFTVKEYSTIDIKATVKERYIPENL